MKGVKPSRLHVDRVRPRGELDLGHARSDREAIDEDRGFARRALDAEVARRANPREDQRDRDAGSARRFKLARLGLMAFHTRRDDVAAGVDLDVREVARALAPVNSHRGGGRVDVERDVRDGGVQRIEKALHLGATFGAHRVAAALEKLVERAARREHVADGAVGEAEVVEHGQRRHDRAHRVELGDGLLPGAALHEPHGVIEATARFLALGVGLRVRKARSEYQTEGDGDAVGLHAKRAADVMDDTVRREERHAAGTARAWGSPGMRDRVTRTFGAYVIALTLGCADTGTSADAGAGPLDLTGGPVTLDNLRVRYLAARCHAAFRCLDDERFATWRNFYGTEASCALLQAAQENTFALDESVCAARAGRLRFDPVMAQRCLDQSAAQPCVRGASLAADRTCAAMFIGASPLAAPCGTGAPCASDAYCDNGTCRARAAAGMACTREATVDCTVGDFPCTAVDGQCAGGDGGGVAYCLHDTTGDRCVDMQIGAPAAEGQFCGVAPLSVTVARYTPCASGLGCFADGAFVEHIEVPGTCRRLPAAGEPCDSLRFFSCAGGAVCTPGRNGQASVCSNETVQSRVGDPCDASGPRYCNATRYLVCRDGACQSVGDGTRGSACTRVCNRGLVCDDGTCQPLRAAGTPCRFGDTCRSGRCTARPGEEGVCTPSACG